MLVKLSEETIKTIVRVLHSPTTYRNKVLVQLNVIKLSKQQRAFVFPWGSEELLCTCTSAFAYVPSCSAMFRDSVAPVQLAGVWIPLYFAVFVHTPVPVHALSQHWQACEVSGLLLSTCTLILVFCYSTVLCPSIGPGLFGPLPSLVSRVDYISEMGALLPFCIGAHGWAARIWQPWEQYKSHLGASCQ